MPTTQLMEMPLALWAVGWDRCQDLQTLRTDAALTTLVGYELCRWSLPSLAGD